MSMKTYTPKAAEAAEQRLSEPQTRADLHRFGEAADAEKVRSFPTPDFPGRLIPRSFRGVLERFPGDAHPLARLASGTGS